MVGWGSMALFQCAAHNFAGMLVIRLILGAFEAGFFAGVVFYLTLFYTRGELGFRIALFFGSALLASAFSGLISFGVFQIEQQSSHSYGYQRHLSQRGYSTRKNAKSQLDEHFAIFHPLDRTTLTFANVSKSGKPGKWHCGASLHSHIPSHSRQAPTSCRRLCSGLGTRSSRQISGLLRRTQLALLFCFASLTVAITFANVHFTSSCPCAYRLWV